jgi:hypothetical protein
MTFLRRGFPAVLPKYVTKECNPTMNKFNVKIVDCSYMFRLPKSNHCIKVMDWQIIFFYYVRNIRYTS